MNGDQRALRRQVLLEGEALDHGLVGERVVDGGELEPPDGGGAQPLREAVERLHEMDVLLVGYRKVEQLPSGMARRVEAGAQGNAAQEGEERGAARGGLQVHHQVVAATAEMPEEPPESSRRGAGRTRIEIVDLIDVDVGLQKAPVGQLGDKRDMRTWEARAQRRERWGCEHQAAKASKLQHRDALHLFGRGCRSGGTPDLADGRGKELAEQEPHVAIHGECSRGLPSFHIASASGGRNPAPAFLLPMEMWHHTPVLRHSPAGEKQPGRGCGSAFGVWT